MSTKRHSICLAGLVVFALCAATAASSNDRAFRAKSHRSRTDSMMQRDLDDCPDLDRGISQTSPTLRWTRATRVGASRVLRFLGAAIPVAGVVVPAPVGDRFEASLSLSMCAVRPLRAPSGRAPPSLSIS